MQHLSTQHIETVAAFLKGKRQEKFLGSVEVLQASAAEGEWTVKRGRAHTSPQK